MIRQWLKEHRDWLEHSDLLVCPPTPQEIAHDFPDADSDVVNRCREMFEGPITRGAQYVFMRRSGETERWSATIALQQTARIMTDSVFFSGMPGWGDEAPNDRERANLVRLAKSQGYTPSAHDVYMPSLAARRGDPKAWIRPSHGRSYIRQLCKERGWGCDGAVALEAKPTEGDYLEKAPRLAEDIVQRNVREMIKKDPSLKKKKRQELREMVIDKHGEKR